ncbi:hypothetical protein TRIUR3_25193 [Triticum urartu]|uniref:Uncharacterized protein n=1 Tax=Triticum urartu TaxID=4572 RepID=M7ZF06_TRIUA|nr:hypothetical protein TRIUR3_25193 [Triticum urartu]
MDAQQLAGDDDEQSSGYKCSGSPAGVQKCARRSPEHCERGEDIDRASAMGFYRPWKKRSGRGVTQLTLGHGEVDGYSSEATGVSSELGEGAVREERMEIASWRSNPRPCGRMRGVRGRRGTWRSSPEWLRGRRRGDELLRARAQARPEHGGQGDDVAWLALPGGGEGRRGEGSVEEEP